ncbi:hypothetical protein LTR16_000395 [Cryomyces antarcticus]|uniref:Uncharacterized protein n=1 Tax=Cryomyces antarcticus TaxID=329879 RepID=A0ABR0M017_9PEZI|nr:hypothetical protein LTR39_000262 [Cryomyces antarcticus]KAK5021113.1 hypothetical protein LTR60_000112 [Cryomyces antarcticus]KAK5257525.1 hypothetical protein LTR16_000395 [Cryomyces antarcticus]
MPRHARRSSYQQEESRISILGMNRNKELIYYTPNLNKDPAKSLADHLQDISRLAKSALIVVVQGDAPWLGTALEQAIPDYRDEIIKKMYEENGPIQLPWSPYAGGRARGTLQCCPGGRSSEGRGSWYWRHADEHYLATKVKFGE